MSKNFATFKQVLGGLVTLREAGGAAPPLAAAAGVAAAAAPEAAPLAVPGLLETLVGPDACQRLDPWAAFFHHQLPAVVQSLLDKDVLVVVLAAGLLLLGLRFLVDLLRFVEHASWDPQDSIALLTHYVFKVGGGGGCCCSNATAQRGSSVPQAGGLSCWVVGRMRSQGAREGPTVVCVGATWEVCTNNNLLDGVSPSLPQVVDVPDSTQEMVVACLLAYLVRVLVNRLVALLPAPPAAAAPAREGTPSVTSPPTSPEPPHSKSDEHEQEGVKYEGYAEAIAGMQVGRPLQVALPFVDNLSLAWSSWGGMVAASCYPAQQNGLGTLLPPTFSAERPWHAGPQLQLPVQRGHGERDGACTATDQVLLHRPGQADASADPVGHQGSHARGERRGVAQPGVAGSSRGERCGS